MKLLLDTCVSGLVVAPLKAAGHDVVWAGEWPTDPAPADRYWIVTAYVARQLSGGVVEWTRP